MDLKASLSGGVLVIGATVKKELHAVTLSDCPIMDNQWHSVTVSHCSGKRPFGQSYVTVYIDGKEKKMVQLKFPSLYEVKNDFFRPQFLYVWLRL